MKKEIENREDLLRSLALRGDCHAFFSLGAPYFKARYLNERSTGALHEDAQTHVLTEATELLEKLQHVAPGRIDAWFEEHCIIISPSQEDQQPASVPDKKTAAETAAFLSRCSRELLRSGSQLKNAQRRRSRRFPHVLLGNRIFVVLFTIAGAVGLFFAVALLMTRLQASLLVSFEMADRHFSVRIPPKEQHPDDTDDAVLPALNASIPQKPVASTPPSTPDITPQAKNPTPPSRPATPEPSTVPVEKRPLPPVVPKARMILPPMPPQTVDPAALPPATTGPEPATSQSAPPPVNPQPSPPSETGPAN